MLVGGYCSEVAGGPYGGTGRGSGVVGSSRVVVTGGTSRCRNSTQKTSLLKPEAMQEGH
jgi:hypothetical protein